MDLCGASSFCPCCGTLSQHKPGHLVNSHSMTRTVLSHTRPMTPSHQRQGWGVARSLRMSCRLADCPAANTLSRSVGEVAGLCAAVAVVSFGAASPANAAKLSLQLSGVSYQEVQCETRTGFTCVRFSGEVNNTDKKSINTADIYGRVYGEKGMRISSWDWRMGWPCHRYPRRWFLPGPAGSWSCIP